MKFSLFRSWSVAPARGLILPKGVFPGTAGLLAALAFAGVARADLLVLQPGGSGKGPGVVHRYSDTTGARLAVFGEVNEGMRGMCVDAKGQLFVAANTLGQCDIYRFDGDGRFLGSATSGNATEFMAMAAAADGTFFGVVLDGRASGGSYRIVRATPGSGPATFIESGAGGLTSPRALVVGPDGHLYVADQIRGILRFDGTTGDFKDVFVAPGRGGLQDPVRLAFGADGRLYVASAYDHTVRRFDRVSGGFVDVFVSSGSGGLKTPGGMAFGPDGNLYLSSRDTNQVLRYHGSTGSFLDAFASDAALQAPTWLAFAPPSGVATALGLAQR